MSTARTILMYLYDREPGAPRRSCRSCSRAASCAPVPRALRSAGRTVSSAGRRSQRAAAPVRSRISGTDRHHSNEKRPTPAMAERDRPHGLDNQRSIRRVWPGTGARSPATGRLHINSICNRGRACGTQRTISCPFSIFMPHSKPSGPLFGGVISTTTV